MAIEINFLNVGLTAETFCSLSQTRSEYVSSGIECNSVVDGFKKQGFNKTLMPKAGSRAKEEK